MTSQEVHNYISMEHVVHSSRKLTKVIFDDGNSLIGQLLAEDQIIKDSLQKNIWNFRVSGEMIEIPGEKIVTIKVA
jgi:hypothetical protein